LGLEFRTVKGTGGNQDSAFAVSSQGGEDVASGIIRLPSDFRRGVRKAPFPFPFAGLSVANVTRAENLVNQPAVIVAVLIPNSRNTDADKCAAAFNPGHQSLGEAGGKAG